MADLLPQPNPATPMVGGGFTEGQAALAKYKRKFDMTEQQPAELEVEQSEMVDVHANGGQGSLTSPLVEFDLPSYQACGRFMTGVVEFKLQIQTNARAPYGDDTNTYGVNAAWIREGFASNLVDEVDVIVNGQSVVKQDYHDIISYVDTVNTLKKVNAESSRMESFAGIYKASTVVPTHHVDGTPYNIEDKVLGPHTMPSTIINHVTTATHLAPEDQEPYHTKYMKPLTDSRTFVVRVRLNHPMFQDDKLYPPEYACKVRLRMAKNAHLYQCLAAHVPHTKLISIVYKDKLVRLTDKAARSWASTIIRNGGLIVMPLKRKVLFQNSLPTGVSNCVLRLIQGELPVRMSVFFIDNLAWRAGSSVENPFYLQFPGITQIHAKYARKIWPAPDSNKLDEVPATFTGANPRLTVAQLEALIRRNYGVFKDNMSVFAKASEVGELEITPADWFQCCCVWNFDLSPTQTHVEFPNVVYPRQEGVLELDLKFAAPLPADKPFTVVTIAHFDNTVTFSVPTWEAEKNF